MSKLFAYSTRTRLETVARRRKIVHAVEEPPEEDVIPEGPSCIWPEPYNHDSKQGLKMFLFDLCWTLNDAEKQIQQLPRLPHLEAYADAWWECRQAGSTLIVEKSRRIVVSWCDRACMLWAMGLQRERRIIAGITKEKAGLHVDRLAFVYEQIRRRNPDWGLPLARVYQNKDVTGLIILPNGSKCERTEQDHTKLQGEGYAGVTIEELPLFRRPDRMIAQAGFIVQGSAGSIGGNVVAIANANPNPYWQDLKPKVKEQFYG